MRPLPEDLQWHISSFLDVPSLLRMRLLNHGYRERMSRNEAGWSAHCQRLWRDKVFVPQQATTHEHAMVAYQTSLEDATYRQDITMQELCYLVSEQKGTIWSFRFKQSAGDDWTAVDPWYRGQEERRMVFLTDNTVKEYIAYTSQEYKNLTIPIFARLDTGVLVDPFGRVTWRWLSQPMDLPTRQATGSYIRLQVGGRDVPTYVVRRSPTNNWGFIMESCWGLYASFPLPPRATHSLRLRHVPPNSVRLVPISDDEGDANETNDSQQVLLVDDSALIITNEVQWREALLYNFGVGSLPEGTEAAQVFDQTWGEALSQAFQ
mmetsp:Transcript_22229/g.40379  ORF Transcript_22229/g.40379 Transcript_22229/m.40379 type:complete len:320 (+) Transcript_22229:191-1150(+)|eukprot:CAMPEP_0202500338 /NCGR_PEP_ID=MMETSP1361-20130828/32743_1 /ASSEMBLY_ACC=CAM_ASM_000849 /TAXON_ID=210615 /ORGANISM="Staurosira complex sp., Strain CCMP2646" /LENGTH=319 /DNA_ID=CAMNT_0049132763 /DNA_START=145 /DNA_END=1104 /DNA_ORIENTATION=+